jgi:hypothetical protein
LWRVKIIDRGDSVRDVATGNADLWSMSCGTAIATSNSSDGEALPRSVRPAAFDPENFGFCRMTKT